MSADHQLRHHMGVTGLDTRIQDMGVGVSGYVVTGYGGMRVGCGYEVTEYGEIGVGSGAGYEDDTRLPVVASFTVFCFYFLYVLLH